MHTIQIIPSTLVNSEEEFIAQTTGLGESVEMIQLDIADGEFVPNTTWADPDVVRQTSFSIELHLMVKDPLKELERWRSVDQVRRVLFHVEAVQDSLVEVVHFIRDNYEWQIGVVLNPQTEISLIEPVLPEIDLVMFMGVQPGKQGQKFLPETIERIRQFKELGTNHLVSVDGAVNENTIKDLFDAGANIVAPGSAVFHKDKSPEDQVEELYHLVDQG
jgi:ribulose-phosphate 3-epimerase